MDELLTKQSIFYDEIKRNPYYLKSVWDRISPFVKGRVLDIGGNDGTLLDFYHGKEKYVFDVAKQALQKAEKKGYKTQYGDMHTTKFKSRFFDTIILIHTFEHSPKPFEFLKELNRIAKKNANIIIEVPNSRSCRQLLNLLRGDPLPSGNSPLFLETPNHYFQYTSKTLFNTLKKAGLKNIRIMGKLPVRQPYRTIFKLFPNSFKNTLSTDIIAVANPK